jgi:hypothetical protein
MRALVFELAGVDSQGELILLRRQRAGGEVRECAGRIEGFVEVDLDAIRMGQSDVEEAAGAIGLRAGEVISSLMPRMLTIGMRCSGT